MPEPKFCSGASTWWMRYWETVATFVRLHFQQEFPVEKVTYFVKPLSSRFVANEQMALLRFNSNPSLTR